VNPERFEYLLTRKGWQIAPIMPMLAQIGDSLGMSGASGPPMIFVNRKTGAEIYRGFIDQKTGEPVSPVDLDIREGDGTDNAVRWRLSHAGTRRRALDDILASAGEATHAQQEKPAR